MTTTRQITTTTALTPVSVALKALSPKLDPARQDDVDLVVDLADSVCDLGDSAAVLGDPGLVSAVYGGSWKNGSTDQLFDGDLARYEVFVNAALQWRCDELLDSLGVDHIPITADAEERHRAALEQLENGG